MEKRSKTPKKAPSKKTSGGGKNTQRSKAAPSRKGSSKRSIPQKILLTPPTGAESKQSYFEDLGSRIAKRAYELYLQRGLEHGHDIEDWLEAERQILPKEISEGS